MHPENKAKAKTKAQTKAFGSGVIIGAGLVLALYLVLAPGYADYRARVESDEILRNLRPVQAEIEARARRQASLSDAGLNIQAKPPAGVALLVRPDGTLIARGQRHGQVLVLMPSHAQGHTTWACLASGQDKDVPSSCRFLRAASLSAPPSPH